MLRLVCIVPYDVGIYIIVSGLVWSEVISILDPCWGLETNGKSVGHDPCIAKVQLNKFQRATPFVNIYHPKYASIERVPFKLLSSWQNYFTWIQLCFKHCFYHF